MNFSHTFFFQFWSLPVVVFLTFFIFLLLSVHSNIVVDVKGGKFPLFTVDLKFSEAISAVEPAKFIYSAPAEMLYNSILGQFDLSFELLKGDPKRKTHLIFVYCIKKNYFTFLYISFFYSWVRLILFFYYSRL